MARSFFAMLRGSEGRSLGRALAALVLLNALFGSFHAGAMAAAPPQAMVLCLAGHAADMPAPDGQTRPGGSDLCCVLGCVPALATTLTDDTAPLLPAPGEDTALATGIETALLVTDRRWPAPRGPPVLV